METIYFLFSLLYVFSLHFYINVWCIMYLKKNIFSSIRVYLYGAFYNKFVFDCSFTKNSFLQVTVSKIGYCYNKIDYCYNTLTLTALKLYFG